MMSVDCDALQAELKKKRICRFCLSPSKITNIFMRDTRIKSSAPLPIQIMAIASIEVFSNDGMPPFVCTDCTNMFEYSYQFKQMCKKADNLLRQFPLTGKLPTCLEKPISPINKGTVSLVVGQSKMTQVRMENATKTSVQQESLLLPKKILNSSVASKVPAASAVITTNVLQQPEQDIQVFTNAKKTDEDCSITFLDKIENNDELSLDDIQQLVAAEDVNETEFVDMENLPIVVVDSGKRDTKPKLLNKSHIRILNKEAEADNEPRLSFPKMKKAEDGKMEIVAEILNIDDKYMGEPDPKNAVPIETNVFPCHSCDRTFPLLQLRDIHMKNHTRDRKFQCDECGRSFFSKYDLYRHSFVHNGEKPFKCSACDKGFARSSLLTRHERIHADVPKHICVHCERSFISKDDMEKHAERHNINRPFVCKICKKGFAFKQGLERHEVIHSRQQPYSCHYCEKSFSTTTKLSRHLTAHAGRRPYPCKFCKKSYLLSHHLTRHMRCHKNVNDPINAISFMCMRCNTSFETRDELINHSTTHANEQNLSCPLCKDVFSNMLELTSHIQDHSEGEAYACEFCDLIFMTAEKLQSHTDLDHSQEMEVYHADDLAQAEKQREEAQKKETDISDEKLQTTVNEFLDDLSYKGNETENYLKTNIKKETDQSQLCTVVHHSEEIHDKYCAQTDEQREDAQNQEADIAEEKLQTTVNQFLDDLSYEGNESENSLKKNIKKESENQSPKIINQIIIRNAADKKNNTKKTDDNTSLLIPLKQRKIEIDGKTVKTNSKTPQQTEQSPKLRRRTPNVRETPGTGDLKQSLLKFSKNVSVSKTSPPKKTPSKSPPSKKLIVANSVPTPKIIKVEKETPTRSSSSTTADDYITKTKTDVKKVKVQKITVTKAQAAAMAKDGRIKIKDAKGKSVSFYTFPKEASLRKLWVMFCDRKIVRQNERICALHFKQEDFERNLKFEMGFSNRHTPRLKPGAVPTLDSNTAIKTYKCDKKNTPKITDTKEDSLQVQIKTLERKMDALRKENDMLKKAQQQSGSQKNNTSYQVQNLNLQFISFVSYNDQAKCTGHI